MFSPTSPRYAPTSSSPFDNVDFAALRPDDHAFFKARGILGLIAKRSPDLRVVDGDVVLVEQDEPEAVDRVRVRSRLCKYGKNLADRLVIENGALIFRYATDE